METGADNVRKGAQQTVADDYAAVGTDADADADVKLAIDAGAEDDDSSCGSIEIVRAGGGGGVTSAHTSTETTADAAACVVGNSANGGGGCGASVNGGGADAGCVIGNGVTVDNQYFFEDQVYRIDKKGRIKFGLVIETSETYSGDEDDDFDDVLMRGEVRVAWYPEGKEEVQPENAIALADRTLMPGDVVRRLVPGKDTQRGYCREISMHADVKVLGTKYVLKNVVTERLRPINTWQRDSAVCLDSWVGSTKDVEEKAVLRSTSGARIEISSSDFYAFSDLNSRNTRGIYNPHLFYPGNVVVGRLLSVDNFKLLTPNIPIHKNKKGKPVRSIYTIESVETDAVWVHWQCKALSEETSIETSLLEQPNPCVTGNDLKRLKRLNLFESCMLQISDRNYLTFSKFDTVIKKSQWDREQGSKFKINLAQQQKPDTQSLSVQLSNTSNASNNSSHHVEKIKKKLSQMDSKSKKTVAKTDKISTPNSKEKCVTSDGFVDIKNSAKDTYKTDHEWITDDEDEENDDEFFDKDFNGDNVSTTTSCSSPSPHHSPKHVKRRLLKNKNAMHIKKQFGSTGEFEPKDGDELVTEALLVYSTATVIWQDGSVETGIPSTQLYPIHHLDNHEFFPGDFVVSLKEDNDASFRDYGVIQTVDHHGRTARVKWFTTYTSADEPKPTYNGESEVSVYDLKDHPDFQYRPGTMVIRVANFVGEDATCTAGQIIDNYIDGRAKVWWVDGHISMCWPQDLFEVGQYDHADWGHESEDSWETESENSELGGGTPKISMEESHIISNIERTRVAIARLEEIFNISPNLQNTDVMRKLLTVYKGCRYLDRLLNTTFFHEDNFMGLIERVRKGGNQSISERAQDRKNRLFSYVQASSPNAKQQAQQSNQHSGHHHHQHQSSHYQAIVSVNSAQKLQQTPSGNTTASNSSKEYAPKILFNISSTPFKCSSACGVGSGTMNVGSSSSAHPTNLKRKSSTSIAPATPVAPSTSVTLEAATDEKQNDVPTSLYNLLATQSVPSTNIIVAHGKQSSAPARGSVLFQQNTQSCEKSQEKTNETPTSLYNLLTTQGSPSNNVIVAHSKQSNSPSRGNVALQQNAIIAEKNQLLNSAMINIEKAFEKTTQLKTAITSSQDDSGNCSRIENCDGSSTSYASSSDLTNIDANTSLKVNDDQKSISCSSIELNEDAAPEMVCLRLCTLLKEQLVKCISQIREKYYKEDNLNLTEVFDSEAKNGENTEAVTETKINNESQKSNTAEPDVDLTKNSTTIIDNKDPAAESAVLSIESIISLSVPSECFQILPNAPTSHKFHLTVFHPNNGPQYYRAVQREHRMLKNSLPPGVWVRVFEDRMDLLSVMIEGPKKTPYEDGLFFFDIQLGSEYPKSPPLCHYISYCTDRLNPNLYEDGKVCVSLLGTWAGRDSEVWGPNSTLLQVIVSIQGLILVPEPYFNEAGYEKQKGSQQGSENSRMYNEMVIIKMVQATAKLLQQPPELFRREILEHFELCGMMMYKRVKGWMELSKIIPNTTEEAKKDCVTGQRQDVTVDNSEVKEDYVPPEFPLVPASRGFCLTLAGLLDTFKSKLGSLNVTDG